MGGKDIGMEYIIAASCFLLCPSSFWRNDFYTLLVECMHYCERAQWCGMCVCVESTGALRNYATPIEIILLYSARREDDTFFIFSHFDLFLSNAASNSHK